MSIWLFCLHLNVVVNIVRLCKKKKCKWILKLNFSITNDIGPVENAYSSWMNSYRMEQVRNYFHHSNYLIFLNNSRNNFRWSIELRKPSRTSWNEILEYQAPVDTFRVDVSGRAAIAIHVNYDSGDPDQGQHDDEASITAKHRRVVVSLSGQCPEPKKIGRFLFKNTSSRENVSVIKRSGWVFTARWLSLVLMWLMFFFKWLKKLFGGSIKWNFVTWLNWWVFGW